MLRFSASSIFLCFLFLIGTPSVLPAQSFTQGASFWTPPKSTAQCKSSYQGIGNYTLSRSLTRRPHPNDDGVNFAATYGMWLAETVAGRNVAKHKANMLRIAEAMTYTEARFGKSWSPIYIQSNLLRTTAMFIRVLEVRGQLQPSEKAVLLRWGDKMIPGQKGSRGNQSSDSLMASGVAMLAWGNMKGDARLMKDGYRKFMKGYDYVLKSVGNLTRHPAHRSISTAALSLESEYNVALQHAVEGAAILRNLGIDVTARTVKGQNLHSAVGWWADQISMLPVQGKFTRAWAHNFHVGWIPIYLHAYGNQAAAPKLKSYARKVTSGRSPTFRAVSLGGATDCLW
ncbi:hypothetical protein [Aestuariivita boseongensis]|uniref:hypothetical protein n=1 Tax=Aestuariivita boseongensis TaxID=1470562 RepID=UPI0012F90ADA|nr:hypothetical protein [Aestuariivita boseongensis]